MAKDVVEDRWSAIGSAVPADITGSLQRFFGSGKDQPTGMFVFLEWAIASSEHGPVEMIAFMCGDRADRDLPKTHLCFAEGLKTWSKFESGRSFYSFSTLKKYHAAARKGLLHLSHSGLIPPLSPAVLRLVVPRKFTNYPSLGELDWPEFDGVAVRDRDAFAIRLIESKSIEVFVELEAIFNFGQAVLDPNAGSIGAMSRERRHLKVLIEEERSCRLEHGESQFCRPWSPTFLESFNELSKPGALRAAGLPIGVGLDQLDQKGLFQFLNACLGSTVPLTLAVQNIFHCNTGWNRDPVKELTLDYSVFWTQSGPRIANGNFMSALKGRVGRHVLASLELATVLRGIVDTDLKAHWDALHETKDFSDNNSASQLPANSQLPDIIRRYQAIASGSRQFLSPSDDKNKFFVSLVMKKGSNLTIGGSEPYRNPVELLNREKANSTSIRKSFKRILSNSGATLPEISAALGHANPVVTMRNYRMGPREVADYRASVRFFQGALQSITIDGNDAVRIGLSSEDHDWYRRLAVVSGVASACGLGPKETTEPTRPDFVFVPTPANLLDLYLAHRALKSEKHLVSKIVWNVQGVTILGMVVAIAQWLFQKGFGRALRTAARAGRKGLASGLISMPAVLEI